MAQITKPIILDETGQRQATALESLALNVGYIKGDKGEKGDKPIKGTDYFTPSEQTQFKTDVKTSVLESITIPTKVSELTNDSQFQTLTQVNTLIAGISQFKMEFVSELPSTGVKMTLYMVPKEGTEGDVYNEYLWVQQGEEAGKYELVGSTAVDLTDYVKSEDLATVATSGAYSDLSGKPTIPTVNNATLTIQRNGTNVDTFTANASSDKAINISVPTKVSDLTNDSSFITTSSVGKATLTIQRNGTQVAQFGANATTNVTANISVPTKVSDLTNDLTAETFTFVLENGTTVTKQLYVK